uniref:Uncharacterized protein n=1 Tax=Aegilops tauschii subsp. strangulata TaxID=200361 RepID=A0A453C9S5_AEGTS
MACAPNYIAIGFSNYGLYTGTRGNDGRRRLIDIIRIIPELSRNY